MKNNITLNLTQKSSNKKQLKQWEIIEQYSRERIIKIGEKFLKKQMESLNRGQ